MHCSCFEITEQCLYFQDLYENLMELLDGRGLNNEFVEILVDLSEKYAQGKYVDFLGELAKFVEEK